MGKRYHRWKENVVNSLEIPRDLAWQDSILTVTGDQVCLENYRSILSYQPDLLCVQLKRGRMKIQGKGLKIVYYTKEEMQIRGCVSKISFER